GLKTESDHHFIFDDERKKAPKGRTFSPVHLLTVVPVMALTRQLSFVPYCTMDLHRISAGSSGRHLLNGTLLDYSCSSGMSGNPKECREHARECLKKARSATSQPLMAKFQTLAHSWVRLADDLERAETVSASDSRERPLAKRRPVSV